MLGKATPNVLHHGQRAYLLPVKPGHDSARYKPGQRLSLKTYIPGATEGHVVLTDVQGPRQAFLLGDVTDAIARELGCEHLDAFYDEWIAANDPAWVERWDGEDMIADLRDRFAAHWASKYGWLLRFTLDHTSAPRMLAASPSIYDPLKEDAEGRDEDRGYTTSDSRSFPDEMPALTDDEYALHVSTRSPFRERERLRQQRQDREAGSLAQRLQAAQSVATSKGYDIRSECRVFERLTGQGHDDRAKQQLALIESRVFPLAA